MKKKKKRLNRKSKRQKISLDWRKYHRPFVVVVEKNSSLNYSRASDHNCLCRLNYLSQIPLNMVEEHYLLDCYLYQSLVEPGKMNIKQKELFFNGIRK